MEKSPTNLIWIDLEMTGLDTLNDKIIEIATVVTDNQLNILAEGPVHAIHQSNQCLADMDEWNTKQHTKSGLVERVKNSTTNESIAEQDTLTFLKQWVPANTSPMCGNSICQDRRFLARLMPDLERFFHYRHLDVSTLKILAQHWAPNINSGLVKQTQHTALADVYDSIEELKYYKKHFIKTESLV